MPKKTNDLKPYERYPVYKRILERRDEHSSLGLTEILDSFERETGLKVNRKMVTRDIDNMASTFGVIEVDGHPKRYYIDPSYSQKYRLDLSETELQTLVLSLEHMKASSLEVFTDHCQKLERAIDLSLPDDLKKQLEHFKGHYSFSYGSYGRPHPWDEKSMEVILQSLRLGRTIKCKNISPYQDEEYNKRARHFAPLQLSMAGNTPYLLVKDMDNGELRRPSALRLVDIEITEIQTPKINMSEINIPEFSFGGFGGIDQELMNITIKCKGPLATFLHERIIHPSQKIESLGKGVFLVSLKTPYSSEIPRFLSGYGADILEIKPNKVLKEVEEYWNVGKKDQAA